MSERTVMAGLDLGIHAPATAVDGQLKPGHAE